MILDDVEFSVSHTGQVYGSVPMSNTLYCPMDLEKFPFDTQLCEFTIGRSVLFSLLGVARALSPSSVLRSRRLSRAPVSVSSNRLRFVRFLSTHPRIVCDDDDGAAPRRGAFVFGVPAGRTTAMSWTSRRAWSMARSSRWTSRSSRPSRSSTSST